MCGIVADTGILNRNDDAVVTAFRKEMSYHGSTFYW